MKAVFDLRLHRKRLDGIRLFCKKQLTSTPSLCYYNVRRLIGEVSERFKELVLKTSDSSRSQGFESLPLRQHFSISKLKIHTEKYPSGEGAPLLRE